MEERWQGLSCPGDALGCQKQLFPPFIMRLPVIAAQLDQAFPVALWLWFNGQKQFVTAWQSLHSSALVGNSGHIAASQTRASSQDSIWVTMHL